MLGKHFSAEIRRGIVINKFTSLETVEEYLREIDESFVVGGSNRVTNIPGEPMNRRIPADNNRAGHNRNAQRDDPPIVRGNNQGHNVRTLVCMEEPEVDLLSDPEDGTQEEEGIYLELCNRGYSPEYLQFGTAEVNPVRHFVKFPEIPECDETMLEEDRRVAFERLKDGAARRVRVAQEGRSKEPMVFAPGDKLLKVRKFEAMGEQSIPPQENGVPDKQKPNSPHGDSNDMSNMDMNTTEDDDFEDMTPEDFEKLNSQLDALNSALDNIEQKNDNIHAQLVQLLNANREVRHQLQVLEPKDGSSSDTN
ncbi:unnamed protein product [Callosobruchus maculatus]|uniref:Uncharacterized protein n=1 Tax=Callosobruchus maculatus TaxID=64391 RepID=A0A653C741_CALMS|nr:unnamed protein product [Callosobruchus maculatus]